MRAEVERGSRNEITEADQRNTERDLQAQESMAFWALVMALAAVLTFFVSVYVAIIVRKTLQATADAAGYAKAMAEEAKNATGAAVAAASAGRKANEIARKANVAQLRPWLDIDVIETIGFKITNKEPSFVSRIKIENVGRSPALSVAYFAAMAFGEGPEKHLDETIEMYKSGNLDWREPNLFHGADMTRRVSCDHAGESPQIPIQAHYYVVAMYRTGLSEDVFWTAEMYKMVDLRRSDELIDFEAPPYGENLFLRNEGVCSYAI